MHYLHLKCPTCMVSVAWFGVSSAKFLKQPETSENVKNKNFDIFKNFYFIIAFIFTVIFLFCFYPVGRIVINLEDEESYKSNYDETSKDYSRPLKLRHGSNSRFFYPNLNIISPTQVHWIKTQLKVLF